MSEGQQGHPAIPVDSCLGPCVRSRGVDQLSRVTAAQVRGPVVLTSSPQRLAIGFEGPQIRPALPAESGSGPKARGVDQVYRATRDRV